MHGFPRDRAIRLQWEKFVKTNRKDFKNATRHSNICSKHFHEDCFEIPFSPQMLSSGYHASKVKHDDYTLLEIIVGDILKDNTDQNISFDLSEPNYMGSGATNCIPPEESESFRTNKKPSVRTIGIQVGTPQIDVFDCVEMASACDSDSSSDQSWAPEEVDSLRADSDEDCSIFQKKYVVDAVSLSAYASPCELLSKRELITPEGNLSLSAAILFSGALPAQVLKLLKFWGVVAYCRKTFFDHQKNLLIPAIEKVWAQEETLQLSRLTECESIFIAGDGRCDSPGYNAKYLSYTLMNCTFKRDFNYPVDPGLKKKLLKLSTNKGNERIKPWINSIIRHLYWCATTSHGNGDLVLAKWEGVVNHICNIHIHANPLFPQCLHGPLDKDWLMPVIPVDIMIEFITGVVGTIYNIWEKYIH
ncbi:hypothetical protein GQR58_002380 [Nymphon striatum]|nr:hypothetical protein GQR58_002380 [Nymphon striatum]